MQTILWRATHCDTQSETQRHGRMQRSADGAIVGSIGRRTAGEVVGEMRRLFSLSDHRGDSHRLGDDGTKDLRGQTVTYLFQAASRFPSSNLTED